VSIPLHLQITASGLPQPVTEYRFAPPRRWRFDYCWPNKGLACEVEGGVWVKGRHTRGTGYEKDCEKYNAAVLAGWRVLRVTTGMVQSGEALKVIEAALGQ
jgi:hypothetical protein